MTCSSKCFAQFNFIKSFIDIVFCLCYNQNIIYCYLFLLVSIWSDLNEKDEKL